MIGPEKTQALNREMQKLGLKEADLVEKFVRSSGKGGQNVNKVNTCVYIKHLPTGLEVKCQRTRSQTDNRYFARQLLCQKMDRLVNAKKSAEQQRIEKIRRQKRKRSKRAKDKMLADKKKRSDLKKGRQKVKE